MLDVACNRSGSDCWRGVRRRRKHHAPRRTYALLALCNGRGGRGAGPLGCAIARLPVIDLLIGMLMGGKKRDPKRLSSYVPLLLVLIAAIVFIVT
jgi:hypothetical protein